MRRLATVAMMAALSGALFAGCQLGDADSTPIRAIANIEPASPGVQNPVAASGVTPVGGAQAASIGVSNAPGAKFFQMGARQKLFLGCPGDQSDDGTVIDDYDCGDFLCQAQAQAFLEKLREFRGNDSDCHLLDGAGRSQQNGIPCDFAGLPAVCP